MVIRFKYILIGLGFFFLLLACNKRYASLTKVDAIKKRGTITIQIENLSPELLNKSFEMELEKYCIKRVEKEGYNYTNKNPKYLLALTMKVDSAFTRGVAYTGPGFGYNAYSRMSKGIQLYMDAKYIPSNKVVWYDKYELYFFNDFNRDLSRTKGVIKYMLSGINEESN